MPYQNLFILNYDFDLVYWIKLNSCNKSYFNLNCFYCLFYLATSSGLQCFRDFYKALRYIIKLILVNKKPANSWCYRAKKSMFRNWWMKSAVSLKTLFTVMHVRIIFSELVIVVATLLHYVPAKVIQSMHFWVWRDFIVLIALGEL